MNPRYVEDLTLYWTAAQRAVAAFLRTLISDPNDCQDVLQQVAVVVVRKFHEFDRTRSFNAWTIGIAKQEVLAMRRRRRTDRLVFSDAMVSASPRRTAASWPTRRLTRPTPWRFACKSCKAAPAR